MQIDRHIWAAAKLYNSLAPILAPTMKELFGEGKTAMANRATSDGISQYQSVRKGPEGPSDGREHHEMLVQGLQKPRS